MTKTKKLCSKNGTTFSAIYSLIDAAVGTDIQMSLVDDDEGSVMKCTG